MDTGFQLRKSLIAAVMFLIPLAVYLLATYVPRLHVSEPLQHLFLTLTAVMGVHLLDRLVLFRETYSTLKTITDEIKDDVREQIESIVSKSASLQAMIAKGIGRLYSGREDAANDMERDLTDPANKSIRLLGISLNDFIRSDNHPLALTWGKIKEFIEKEREIDIKLLLIDPECFGAQMRSRGEARAEPPSAGKLSEDVRAVADSLLSLEELVQEKKEKHMIKKKEDLTEKEKEEETLRFECRFYRSSPTLFLCQVDSASYVQQYYFWAHRNTMRSSPLIRFRQTEGAMKGPLIHEGMLDHFDWIWKHASIPISDVLKKKSIGIDKGLHQSGIVNLFASGGEGRDRIQWRLKNAKSKVWIQGVSLKSFFDPGELFNAIAKLIERVDIDLKILFINSSCEQAKYRSYRERLFADPDLDFEAYIASGQHEVSDLFRDTERSITNLRMQVAALQRKKGKSWRPKLLVKKYKTAPGCFMLRVDDSILVEQYHYGKVVPDDQQDAPAILGKDMPLIEYQSVGSTLYDPIELRNPVNLLSDHFEFAFKRAEGVPIFIPENPL